MVNFNPFPKIKTKNLILRKMNHDDINDLFRMRKDPRMHEHTDTKVDESIDDTKKYIDKMNKGIEDNRWIIWAIEHRELNMVIGTISIWNIDNEKKSGELGYGITPDYQGQGLMKEALLSVIEYGFKNMKLSKLDAYTEVNNFNSIKLLEKCNFIEIDRIEDKGYLNNRVYQMVVYSMMNNKNTTF